MNINHNQQTESIRFRISRKSWWNRPSVLHTCYGYSRIQMINNLTNIAHIIPTDSVQIRSRFGTSSFEFVLIEDSLNMTCLLRRLLEFTKLMYSLNFHSEHSLVWYKQKTWADEEVKKNTRIRYQDPHRLVITHSGSYSYSDELRFTMVSVVHDSQ